MTQKTESFLAKLPLDGDSFILGRLVSMLIRKNIGINICFNEKTEHISFEERNDPEKIKKELKLFWEENEFNGKLLKMSYDEKNFINLKWVSYHEFIGNKPMEMDDEFFNLLQFAL